MKDSGIDQPFIELVVILNGARSAARLEWNSFFCIGNERGKKEWERKAEMSAHSNSKKVCLKPKFQTYYINKQVKTAITLTNCYPSEEI